MSLKVLSKKTSCILLIESLLVLHASAALIHSPDIDRMAATSDVIVLGELITVVRGSGSSTMDYAGSPVDVRIDRGTLRIDETLHGRETSLLAFDFQIPMQDIGWRTPVQQSYGIFFFRRGTDGKLFVTDPAYSYIEVPRGLRSRGLTPIDRVVSILSEMLSLPNSRNSNIAALLYLRHSKSKAANVALRAVLDSGGDPQLIVGIANALLRGGDRFGLELIKRHFLAAPRIPIDSFNEEGLGTAMAMGIKDPEAIPDLEELLNSPSVYIRRGAAGALRGVGEPEAIDGLVRAIEDTDSQVRYWGVAGLAEVTGQTNWRPNTQTFKSRELEYVNYWREWARNR